MFADRITEDILGYLAIIVFLAIIGIITKIFSGDR